MATVFVALEKPPDTRFAHGLVLSPVQLRLNLDSWARSCSSSVTRRA